jgi:hypothetical protein
MFGRRTTFGQKQQTFSELKETLRPTPDADEVTRVFPKELWDDPNVGNMLRECGFAPDDARNILPTAQDYVALFAAAKARLLERAEAFNRDMTMRYGYCRAVPFLVIDDTIWDGVHGAFLYAQMNLIGYDEWNVLMLAGDERTRDACGLAGHPGTMPAVTGVMTKHVIEWRRRHDLALQAYGITATGGRGISKEQYESELDTMRREIVDKVGWMKPRIIDELLRLQG